MAGDLGNRKEGDQGKWRMEGTVATATANTTWARQNSEHSPYTNSFHLKKAPSWLLLLIPIFFFKLITEGNQA